MAGATEHLRGLCRRWVSRPHALAIRAGLGSARARLFSVLDRDPQQHGLVCGSDAGVVLRDHRAVDSAPDPRQPLPRGRVADPGMEPHTEPARALATAADVRPLGELPWIVFLRPGSARRLLGDIPGEGKMGAGGSGAVRPKGKPGAGSHADSVGAGAMLQPGRRTPFAIPVKPLVSADD